MTTRILIVASLVLLGALGIWWGISTISTRGSAPAAPLSGEAAATSTSTHQATSTPVVAVHSVSSSAGTEVKAPDFKKPLVCTQSAEVCAQIQSRVAATREALATAPRDPNAWINLGTLRKIAGDYAGAAAAWEYVSTLYPKNPTSFSNLGDLYLHYLHDTAKAEKNYLTAITNYPQGVDAYRALAELYASGYGVAGAAARILDRGIAANPDAVDLQVLLARYYRTQGDSARARIAYEKAVASATRIGSAALAADIKAEADSK